VFDPLSPSHLHETRVPHRNRQGFTLIELLTVIAIIGILAAIIIPVVGKVRLSARQAQCVSNLREVGVAMAAYVSDNKGYLPGPSGTNGAGTTLGLLSAVRIRYTVTSANDKRTLNYHLAPYSGMNIPSTGAVTLPFLQDEATRLTAPNPDANVHLWVLNSRIEQSNFPQVPSEVYYPFGWTSGDDSGPPKRYEHVASMLPVSRVWAMMQADRKLYEDWGSGNGPYVAANDAAPKPVYGAHRNALFFDWSVGRIPENVDPMKVIENR
jgi:prepilin-type N-terminal cleavage/methylation domain